MNSFPTGGRIILKVCGRMTFLIAWARVSPRASAASICPLGMDWIPALKISPM